jgi:hypothetical protein
LQIVRTYNKDGFDEMGRAEVAISRSQLKKPKIEERPLRLKKIRLLNVGRKWAQFEGNKGNDSLHEYV